MSGSGVTRRGFAAGGLAAAAGLCALAPLSGGLVEGLVASGEFRGHRAYPAGGLSQAPVLVFFPVARGRTAPLHHAFAALLARRGFYVATPELTADRDVVFAALAFAAAEGAKVSVRGVLGYEGGAALAREALVRDPGLRAGLAVSGPLGGNPISGRSAERGTNDKRMLTLDWHKGLLDAGSAGQLVDEALRRLVLNGLQP